MISVIACTHRENFIKNIIVNFKKQSLKDKELILILNSSNLTLDQNLLIGLQAKVLQFPDEITLGECLNQGAAAANYDILAKIDDDDFYGPGYLQEACDTIFQTGAELVGKSSFFIYFQKQKEMRLYNPNHVNCWIGNNGDNSYKPEYFLSGATLVFNKSILSRVPFPAINLGEDTAFQQQCFHNQMKIYSSSSEHYIYIRYGTPRHHTSDIRESILRGRSRFVMNTFSIEEFANQGKWQ